MGKPGRGRVASGLDHVIAAVDDVRGTLERAADLLGLPIAVPWAEYASWQSGGIWAGNACLFFDASSTSAYLAPTDPPRWRALSLRPSLPIEEVAVTLRQDGFRADGPKPYREDGIELWRNVYLPGVVAEDAMLFFTAYGQKRRIQFACARDLFERAAGGPLGIVGVHSIGVGADVRWPDIFACRTLGGGQLPDGIQVVRDGVGRSLTYVTLRVRDMQLTFDYLTGRGMMVERHGDGLRLDPSHLQGLDVRFCGK